jgi:hypothetical protein
MRDKTKVLHATFDMRIDGTEMVIKSLVKGTVNRQFEMSTFCIEKLRCSSFNFPNIFTVLKSNKEKQITIPLKKQYKTWAHEVLASFVTIYNQDKFNYLKLAIL